MEKRIFKQLSGVLTFLLVLGLITPLSVLAETSEPETDKTGRTVVMDMERFTIGQGFYKEPVRMNFTKGETVFDLVSRLAGAENIIGSAVYINGIKGTDAGVDTVEIPDYIVEKLGGGDTAAAKAFGNAGTDSALGTASYSQQGGWMFLVNNLSPDVGMGDYVVKDGDVIRIAFSYWGYGADLTGYEWGSPDPKVVIGNKDELVKGIARVNTETKESYLNNAGIKMAYDNAIAVSGNMVALQSDIDTAAVALNNAIDAFSITCNYQTHVENDGWQTFRSNGEISGTFGRSLRLEGIKINLDENTAYDLGVQYKTHIQNLGWEDSWKSNGLLSGTEGRCLRLEAINIELTGADADKFDIYYQVHAQDIGWMGFAKNGESAGTAGLSSRLEGIKIQVVPKGAPAPTSANGTAGNAFISQ
ncbi:DUF4430 domain-containing protein [Acetobacterium bakii]|uniref:DUF4430 domain-containing protein n=1 Tax=Acetobacterium bakii TaxID=52689 RepID=UPI00068119CD|nr:DUF4430 domain-containing protein [Acetobacterium bakii]